MADLEVSASRFLHVFAGERLQAFSDAVYAIVATLMVIPLKIDEKEVIEGGVDRYDLEEFLVGHWPRYLVYLYSFTLVVITWITHAGVFSLAEQVDDVLIWLNLVCLLLVSFLPYGTGLVSSFPTFDMSPKAAQGENLAIIICSSVLVIIGVVMLVMLLYLFRQRQLLHPDICSNSQQTLIRRAAVVSVLVTPTMALLAIIFAVIPKFPYIALLFFYSIGIVSFIGRSLLHYYYKRKNIMVGSSSIIQSIVSKCRTEAFTDGIFSIVATLVVIDLTTDGGIPDSEDLEQHFNGSLTRALNSKRFVFTSYILSFVTVGLLWFVHYGMMHFIKQLTPLLSTINICTLFLVGVIPFVSEINTVFSDTPLDGGEIDGANSNKILSIRAFCVVFFLVGVGQLLFWTVAIWCKNLCMSSEVDKHLHESLQFSKILVFPVISFITFWGTFSQTFLRYRVYDMLFFSTPFLFLILKALFRRKCFRLRSKRRVNNHLWQKVKGRNKDSQYTVLPLNKSEENDPALC